MSTILQSAQELERNANFPQIHFFDQELVDVYTKTWDWVDEQYTLNALAENSDIQQLFFSQNCAEFTSLDACFSTFFLVYNVKNFPCFPQLDFFYKQQEENGAIRSAYSLKDCSAVFSKNNPHSIGLPLFSWVEYNLYHKLGNKKRVRDILDTLIKYYDWIEANFMDESGLYSTPLESSGIINESRKNAHYLVDFNLVQTVNAYYMSELGTIVNDRDISFNFKRKYFALKTKINQRMWDTEDGFYYDLDSEFKPVRVKTLAAYWSLLVGIPNERKFEELLHKLQDPQAFGSPQPFPSMAVNEAEFNEDGEGYRGSVFPYLTYMVIKGLENYATNIFARSASLKCVQQILDTLRPDRSTEGGIYEAYKPFSAEAASWAEEKTSPRADYYMHHGLATIALVIENVIGLRISLPRKTVNWVVPTLESMGIKNLSLKRNNISILVNKSSRGWEIRLESEKLYYFTIDMPDSMKKTLPIPSGKCSMLIDKI